MVTQKLDLLTADVRTLQTLLQSGVVKSVDLIDLYLAQIGKHDGYLHAMLHIPPRDQLKRVAAKLDAERAGHVRGPLHGVPVIVKVLAHKSVSLFVAHRFRPPSALTLILVWKLQWGV